MKKHTRGRALAHGMKKITFRLSEYRIDEIKKDAKNAGLSYERLLNDLLSFTFYSGYGNIKKAVITRAKKKQKIREQRKVENKLNLR